MSWFSKVRPLFNWSIPDPYAQEDLTNQALGMDWLISALGENKAVPRINDVIIKITSCSMGTSVSQDDRYWVIGPGKQHGESVAVPCVHVETGVVEQLHVFYMRHHTRLARTWWLMG